MRSIKDVLLVDSAFKAPIKAAQFAFKSQKNSKFPAVKTPESLTKLANFRF